MFGVSLPGIGGSASGDLDQITKQVDELSEKLETAKTDIYGMLTAAVPKVSMKLPRLSPSIFSKSDADPSFERAPLLDAFAPALDGVSAGKSNGAKKAADAKMKALNAQKAAAETEREMQENARQALQKQSGMLQQLAAPSITAVVSLGLAVGLAYAELGAFVGPLIAAGSAAFINFISLAYAWKLRADGIFDVIGSVFEKTKGMVDQVLETVDDMIMGPLEQLDGALDDMVEDQKPTIQHMKKFESAMKAADPDFDLPDPEDLKKPLDGCEAMIDEFVATAKKEVPDKLDELIQSSLAGRIATDAQTFNGWVVILPLVIVCLLNVGIAVLQVSLSTGMGPTPSVSEHASSGVTRRLRGSHGQPSALAALHLPDDIKTYVQPAAVQILLTFLQVAAAFVLSQGPQICRLVNGSIGKLERTLNERINGRIQKAVDRVFGQAFGEVKDKADVFFPKFQDCMAKLKQAVDQAAKAAAVAGGAAQGLKKLGFGGA